MLTTIAENVTARFSFTDLTGDIKYDADHHALFMSFPDEGDEVMSVNLIGYGLEAKPDTVFIKDWSEHTGLARSLEAAGVVEIVRALNVGQWRSRAYEVRPRVAAAARELVAA